MLLAAAASLHSVMHAAKHVQWSTMTFQALISACKVRDKQSIACTGMTAIIAKVVIAAMMVMTVTAAEHVG